MPTATSRLLKRLPALAAGVAATALLASSCSLDASITTDASGRIVGVNAVQVRSTVQDVAVAMLLRGTELVLEVRWKELAERAGFEPAGGV